MGVDEVFIESFINKTGCDWAQEFSMFDNGAIKTEHAFEEKIDTIATAKRVIQVSQYPACIKERKYSTSVIDIITGLQGLLQTLANPEKYVNGLNFINPSNDSTRHDIQLNFTLKTQAQLVDTLVQTVSGVIQSVVALSDKDNDSKTFEMALEGLNIAHDNMKVSIVKRLQRLCADSEPSV